MARVLPPWCKRVKIRLIELDMTIAELAAKANMSRPYTSALVHGRAYSEPAVKIISDILNIEDNASRL